LRAANKKMKNEEVNSLDEGITETIVKHNDFTLEITNNPTFGDFLKAIQSIVRTDEESMQYEIVSIAEQAYKENYEEIIIEQHTRNSIQDKFEVYRTEGKTIMNEKYGVEDGNPYAGYVLTDNEGGRKKYIHYGSINYTDKK
jgi:hypothetical protein